MKQGIGIPRKGLSFGSGRGRRRGRSGIQEARGFEPQSGHRGGGQPRAGVRLQ